MSKLSLDILVTTRIFKRLLWSGYRRGSWKTNHINATDTGGHKDVFPQKNIKDHIRRRGEQTSGVGKDFQEAGNHYMASTVTGKSPPDSSPPVNSPSRTVAPGQFPPGQFLP